MTSHRFSRAVFLLAGIYGIVVLAPGFFSERFMAQQMPPPITHPEFYYGFFGVALAWQVAFLMIAGDPVRFRPLMLAGAEGIVEKLIYGVSCLVLYFLARIPFLVLAGGIVDLVLGTLFVIAYARLKPSLAASS